MPVTALIVAAGSGSRMRGEVPKQYRLLAGKPVLRWAVEPFLAHSRVDAVRVVIGAGQEALAREGRSSRRLSREVIPAPHAPRGQPRVVRPPRAKQQR